MLARLIKVSEGGGASYPSFALRSSTETASPNPTSSDKAAGVVSAALPSSGAALLFAPLLPPNAAGSELPSAHEPPDRSEQEDNNIAEATQTMLADAKREAELILQEATASAAEVTREAYERGILEARAQATAEVDKAVEPLREQLTQTLSELTSLRHVIAKQAEQDILRLAVEIARKVVNREVTVDPEITLALARVALSRLHTRTSASVHLHPEDYAYVRAHQAQLENAGAVELVEDRAVGRGGCIVHTEMGDIDARIEQQFTEIERGFSKQ